MRIGCAAGWGATLFVPTLPVLIVARAMHTQTAIASRTVEKGVAHCMAR